MRAHTTKISSTLLLLEHRLKINQKIKIYTCVWLESETEQKQGKMLGVPAQVRVLYPGRGWPEKTHGHPFPEGSDSGPTFSSAHSSCGSENTNAAETYHMWSQAWKTGPGHNDGGRGTTQEPMWVPLALAWKAAGSLLPKDLAILSSLRSEELEKWGPAIPRSKCSSSFAWYLSSACIGLMTDSSTPAWRHTQGN